MLWRLSFWLVASFWAPVAFGATIEPTVTLSWTDNADNEEGFPIQRRVDDAAEWLNRAVADGNGVSVGERVQWVDGLVARGHTYHFRVAAENYVGRSAWAGPVSITFEAAETVPVGPSGVEVAGGMPVERPALANVSARAYVSSNDLSVIPGFVVRPGSDPAESLRVLVRAAGPGLARLDPTIPTIADPRLTVMRREGAGWVEVATNDDWPADLADEMASVFAFAYAAGSKDAAVVVTLPPGQYTVVVRGASGETGVALVEVYALP